MWLSQNADTEVFDINTDSNPFTYTSIGDDGETVQYNSLAFNPVDNFLYAIRQDSGALRELLRINNDGTFVNLGVVSGLPTGTAFNAGDISPTGIYYVKQFTTNDQIFAIDLNDPSFPVTPITLSNDTQLPDLAWIDGMLYGLGTNSGQVVEIDPSTGNVNVLPFVNSGAPFGAAVGATNGLFATSNSGGFYRFDLSDGEGTLISDSPPSSVNDGAHCTGAAVEFTTDVSITKDDGATEYTPGTDVTYTIVITNDGPFGVQDALFEDPLPDGITTASWECSATNPLDCGDVTTGTGPISEEPDLPVGESVTYTLTISVPDDYTGDLVNTATVTMPPGFTDPTPENNSAEDTDQPAPGILRLQKEIPEGRIAGDQFELVVDGTNGGSITTTGTGPTISETITVDPATAGETYTLSENAAGTTNLTNYNITWSCENALDGGQTPSGSGSSFSIVVNPGDDLTCTLINELQPPTFGQCSSGLQLSQNSPTDLIDIDTSTNPFSFPVLGTADRAYNAIGYHPTENVLYGLDSNANLVKVLPDGSVVEVGPVTGLGTPIPNAGEITPDGTYYVKRGGNNPWLFSIDLNTLVATSIQLNASIVLGDLAWYDGLLYAGGGGILAGRFWSIDPDTATAVQLTANSGATGTIGAMFGATNGIFGASNSGGFYEFDPTDGEATLISDSPASIANDGSHCVNALVEFTTDISVTKTDNMEIYTPGTDITYTIVISNDGPFGVQDVLFEDPLPNGITIASWECSATNPLDCGDATTGTGPISAEPDLPAGESVTYSLTISVPEDYTGDLVNPVTAEMPPGFTDPTPENNSAEDTDLRAPSLVIEKISNGDVGTFSFSGTNGVADQDITTTADGVAEAGALQYLTAADTTTDITESAIAAGFELTDISCTGLGSGGSATPDLGTATVTLDASATAAGSDIVCTFTNALQESDLAVTKTAAPSPVVSGGVLTYTITVSNNGPADAPNVLVEDNPDANVDCTIPSSDVSCSANGAAVCPTDPIPVADLTGPGVIVPLIPNGDSVELTVQCTVNATGLP
ncbi:DUF11 domain-containing protein [Microbulbifer litoralis]|uniref:DUF11 domain-containing protein n=1 Tax=Microbulbifer litoralis TaxID=2933965 RepID=UPI0020294BB8|nr:DUF11 domain-containing protein [Microbulbifer sp. GX H0434]